MKSNANANKGKGTRMRRCTGDMQGKGQQSTEAPWDGATAGDEGQSVNMTQRERENKGKWQS